MECDTSIVAVTSFTNSNIEQECLDIGMKRVLNKPLRPESLSEVMKDYYF